MNLSKASKGSLPTLQEGSTTQTDFQKLMQICNSYGLNEEETNQLISEFKKGALFSPEQSFNDSLNHSADLTFSQKHQKEQYSFKHPGEDYHPAKQTSPHQEQDYFNASRHSQPQENHEQQAVFANLERIISERFEIDKNMLATLQQQNDKLRRQLAEKDNKIDNLLAMKKQDTEVVMGLKDVITTLTLTLKEKQQSFRELQDKYTSAMESRVKELSTKRSLTEFYEPELQEITNTANHTITRRDSSSKFPPTPVQMRQSKQPRETRDTRDNRENRETKEIREAREAREIRETRQMKESKQNAFNDMKKVRASNKIDVKKYKEMIENLRNNY